MLLGSYVSELTVPSDVMVATTPSMSLYPCSSGVSISLHRGSVQAEALRSVHGRKATPYFPVVELLKRDTHVEDGGEPRSIRTNVTQQWSPMPRGSGAASAWHGH
jgi:hypothetical protein